MPKMIFVNLPVKDLDRSKKFYSELGYSINPQFSDESTACVVVSETIFVMVMTEEKYRGFLPEGKEIPDATKTAQTLLCISADSREDVDRLADTALTAGGSAASAAQDFGMMYGRSFHDPDGHIWETMWMDPSAVEGQS